MVWRLPPVVSSFRLTLTHYDWLVAFRLLMCKSTRENKQLEIGMLKSTCYLLPSALLGVGKSQCLFGLVKSQCFVASPGPQISSSLPLAAAFSKYDDNVSGGCKAVQPCHFKGEAYEI
jgi:hypothetical protein